MNDIINNMGRGKPLKISILLSNPVEMLTSIMLTILVSEKESLSFKTGVKSREKIRLFYLRISISFWYI